MKKIVVLFVVLLLVFAFTIPAAAGGGGQVGGNGSGGRGPGSGQGQQGSRSIFAITGTIAAIDSGTIIINVIHGNRQVQPYFGSLITVTLTP